MPLQGRMSPMGLTTNLFISHAETYHKDTQVVSINERGKKTRSTWGKVGNRSRHLASALKSLGVMEGDILGTISPNTINHLELLYAISGCGAVAHTINPRLFPDEIVFIINDAKDKILFVDTAYLPFLIGHKHLIPSVDHMYIIGPKRNEVAAKMNGFKFLEDLYMDSFPTFVWPEFDENNAAVLCYTSGTTGNPKGVLYSHKSIVVHANMISLPDYFGFSATDTLMPVTPMFHVNAWGATYASAMVGSKLVLPGPNVNASNLTRLINEEKVTVAIGIPTIWEELLSYLEESNANIKSLKRIFAGGAKVADWMITMFADQHDIKCVQAWGMTETSPVGLINTATNENQKLSKQKTGRPVWTTKFKIVDEDGIELPQDSTAIGEIYIKGPTVINSYLKNSSKAVDEEGWFRTGDIGYTDKNGYITLTDRSKDLIKSGGEWISSIQLEQIICQHPLIYEAAVIGLPHPKWGERPVVVAEAKSENISQDEILDFFKDKVVKWQIPDKVIFVDELPLSSTGKPLKKDLKEKFSQMFTKGV